MGNTVIFIFKCEKVVAKDQSVWKLLVPDDWLILIASQLPYLYFCVAV